MKLNHKKSKQMIISELSKLIGTELDKTTKIEPYIVSGVVIGKLTVEKAAEKISNEWARLSTQAFNKQQNI